MDTSYVLNIIQIILILPVIMISVLYPEKLNDKVTIIVISPVFLFALYLLQQHHFPNLIVFTQSLLFGLLFGCILFSLSIFITEKARFIESLKAYAINIQAFYRMNLKQFEEWNSILYISFMVLYEELIWRVFLIESLSHYLHTIPVILISSFLFYYSHPYQRVLNRQSAELLIFSLIITIIYFYSLSFLLVFFIHWSRNMIIVAHSIGSSESEKALLKKNNE